MTVARAVPYRIYILPAVLLVSVLALILLVPEGGLNTRIDAGGAFAVHFVFAAVFSTGWLLAILQILVRRHRNAANAYDSLALLGVALAYAGLILWARGFG
jgi:ABC-type Na+ efflux pump permease subunit